MRSLDTLSVRARLRISVIALVTAIVLALTALHVGAVLGGALQQAEERAHILARSVQACLTHNGVLHSPASDPTLRMLLRDAVNHDPTVANILLIGDGGAVAASARPVAEEGYAVWPRAGDTTSWSFSLALLRTDKKLAYTVDGSGLPLAVRVLFSPEGLRESVGTQIREFVLVSGMSLALAVILALIVSQLFSRSMHRIGQRIDLIASGDLTNSPDEQLELPELASLETKLFWLGRQFSGARDDFLRMRSNIEMMLRQMEEAVFVFGSDGRLQILGEQAARLLARPKKELAGRTLSDVFPEWTGPGAVLRRALEQRQHVRDEAVMLDRPNLPPLRLLMTVEPIRYGGEGSTGTLVALRSAESRFAGVSHADSARPVAAISRLTSGVAHEIKNPLNAMMLHLQIALDKLESNGAPRPELEIVGKELLRLDRVVKALLEFHRPVEPRISECDLSALTSEVAALIRPQVERQNISVEVAAGAPVVVMADADLLKQAVLNVAVNAVEAMPEGGKLQFSVERGDEFCTVAVRDTGSGIPPEVQDRIFNLYFTTKEKGTGIGLAMTYRILLLHSGTVSVESEPGRGSCFRLSLPVPIHSEVAA